jgi:hypothetical protein
MLTEREAAGRSTLSNNPMGKNSAMVDPEHVPAFVKWRGDDLGSNLWYYLPTGLHLSLTMLAAVATVFVPSFVVRRDCVLLEQNSDEDDLENWWRVTDGNRQEIEAQLNHVHVRDLLGTETSDESLLQEVAEAIATS